MLKNHLLRMARYNLWANTSVCDYYGTQPDEIISRTLHGSFPSIMLTLLHIWDAEIIWYDRLHQRIRTSFPSTTFSGSNTEAMRSMLIQSEKMVDYVMHTSEKTLMEPMQFNKTKGEPYTNTPEEMLQHCFNHSTYHRGQLTNYARLLGLTSPPATDLIRYLRTN